MLENTPSIVAILPSLMRPLARLCLRHAIKLDEALVAFKQALIDAARENSPGDLSATKISAITGVHRKDIAKLSVSLPARTEPKNVIMKIIGQWQNNKKFSSIGGPKELCVEGKESEFCELVNSVSSDLNPYAVLFELKRIGAVKCIEKKIRLTHSTHSVRKNVKAGLLQLSEDVDSLVEAVEDNLFGISKVPNHHLTTEFDNIPEAELEGVKYYLFKEGKAFHAKIRARLARLDRDFCNKAGAREGGLKVTFGSYSRCVKS